MPSTEKNLEIEVSRMLHTLHDPVAFRKLENVSGPHL